MAEAISSAPATPDINAVRSYQMRAQRDERRSKIFGRSLLAIMLLGGAVAAALIFGRSYLFPTQWDAELTPYVDQIQEARDAEFEDTVSLTILPDGEYAAIALEIAVGPQWADELPAWRALGIATGGESSDAIHRAVIQWRPAL